MGKEKPVVCGECQGTGLVSAKAKCPYCGQTITMGNIMRPSLYSDVDEADMRFVFHCPNPYCGKQIVLGLQEVNDEVPCPTCGGTGRSISIR
jgi:RecJ-like exonuclease